MSSVQGPNRLYKPKEFVPSKDPLCDAVKGGSGKGASHNGKGASQKCDYRVDYADRSYSEGVLVRDNVRVLLTSKTLSTSNSVIGYVLLLLISLFVSSGFHFFETTSKTVKITKLGILIRYILGYLEKVTTYFNRA